MSKEIKHKRILILKNKYGAKLGAVGYFILDARRKSNEKEIEEYKNLPCFRATAIVSETISNYPHNI